MRLQYRTAHMTVSNFRNKYINHWFIYVAHMHERAVYMVFQTQTFEKTGQYLRRIHRGPWSVRQMINLIVARMQ